MIFKAYDFDFGGYDEFIDSIRIDFKSNPATLVTAKHMGVNSIGILTISYQISCLSGYCGSDCSTFCTDVDTKNTTICMLMIQHH